jgi:hypothetical protein
VRHQPQAPRSQVDTVIHAFIADFFVPCRITSILLNKEVEAVRTIRATCCSLRCMCRVGRVINFILSDEDLPSFAEFSVPCRSTSTLPNREVEAVRTIHAICRDA